MATLDVLSDNSMSTSASVLKGTFEPSKKEQEVSMVWRRDPNRKDKGTQIDSVRRAKEVFLGY